MVAAQNLYQQYGETAKGDYTKKAKYLHVSDKRRHSDQVTSNGLDYKKEHYEASYLKRKHDGSWHWERYVPGMETTETHDLGEHSILYPDGSKQVMRSGNVSECNKQGCTTSNMGNHDEVQGRGTVRSVTGTQGSSGGGNHFENAGNETHITQGMTTEASGGNKSSYTPGKHTMNAEKGIGLGVNKGGTKNCWMRMEADGTYHLQVKPAGGEGGAAVVKIDPSGAITITSQSTMSITTAGQLSMKAPGVFIDAPVTTTSSITSAGPHVASAHV